MNKSILVIFGENLPKKSKKWFAKFDEIIGPKELKNFVKPGSIHQAHHLVGQLPELALSDGRILSKSINYQGYELWWVHYDSIYRKFCLPYTQYAGLLSYLKDFEKIYLFEPPWPDLFRYFLKAYHRRYFIFSSFLLRKLLPISFGGLIQFILSIVFLPWLMISSPKLMVYIGDKFDQTHDYDFRMKFIYEELRRRKIPFVEFIRSLEPWSVVLRHAWKRKRPVVYPTAVISFIHFLGKRFGQKKEKELKKLFFSSDSEQYFWFLAATHYLRNIRGTIWSIRAMKLILQGIGVKAANIVGGCERNFHTVLGCKLAGVKTIGIQHGAIPRYFFVSDFMPGFDGPKPLSVDKYGLWSEWWKKYYLEKGNAYRPEQLYVSGPMRPLTKEKYVSGEEPSQNKEPQKVLYISEGLAVPAEVLPYILTLLETKDFELYFKFRPYRDGFELWLKENQPEIYDQILKRAKILRGGIEEAVSQCDVVVGSHSTAVLEGLLELKPFIFFWTDKWGDYRDIRSFDTEGRFFADSPQELIEKIRKSVNVSKEDLRKLQEQFFGNPYQNGSKWVIDQIQKFL